MERYPLVTVCYGKSPCFIGKPTIFLCIFDRYATNYHRVETGTKSVSSDCEPQNSHTCWSAGQTKQLAVAFLVQETRSVNVPSLDPNRDVSEHDVATFDGIPSGRLTVCELEHGHV